MSKPLPYYQFVADQIYHKSKHRYCCESFGNQGDYIKIYCLKHGWFWQLRSCHDTAGSKRAGCTKCGQGVSKKRSKHKDIAKELNDNNLKILSPYLTIHKNINFLCYCGETHTRSLANLRASEYKCPNYSNKKFTLSEVSKVCESFGCTLLSKNYKNKDEKLTYRCKCGATFSKTFGSFKQIGMCPNCGRLRGAKKLSGANLLGLASFITWGPRFQELGIPCREGVNDILEVKCYRCNKWFFPIKNAVQDRYRAALGNRLGESNLYCGDYCIGKCKVHNFRPDIMIDPDSKLYVPKTEREKVRACATIDRRELIRLQVDEFGYNYCDKCGKTTDKVEHHHTQEVAKVGREAITSAGHMLLCVECHKEFTAMCRK